MNDWRRLGTILVAAVLCALLSASYTRATGVPINGFLPYLGISLTDEFKDDSDDTFYFADPEASYVGSPLGAGGNAHFDLALLDIGAAISLLTTASDAAFNIQGEGFRGTKTLTIGGATGFLEATINDPMAMFVTGLGNRTASVPLGLNTATMKGQSSVSLVTIPEESDLPNVIGIPFASQYATHIRADQPQIFTHNGRTVRTPQIELNPLGSGGQGIVRRAPITLDSANGFLSPPLYIFNFENIINGNPLTQNPQAPTILAEAGALFLSVDVENGDESLNNFDFFFDTGADITVVSELNAVRLGFDPILDEPEFTVAVVGSGGVNFEVPGFFVDEFTIQVVGGTQITATNVPVIVLDVANPANPGNIVDGIVGTNLLSGRNLVIDPKPAQGGGGVGPSLYISDPVTTAKNWTTTAASGTWSGGGNWSGGAAPNTLGIANVRHVTGGNQEALVTADATVWELNVSGAAGATMTVRVQSGVKFTTFSGVNLEAGGRLRLDGGTLDTQFVDIRGGTLTGSGTIATGSGPLPGQVENQSGIVAPGNGAGSLSILGRYSNGNSGTLAIDLGGTTVGTQHDQLVVTGGTSLDGTLAVSLIDAGGGLFSPIVGSMFTILTATEGVGGVFDTYLLPNGFVWNIAYGENNVVAKVIGVGIGGDFNLNGIVDAADYAVLRAGMGTTYQLADYKIWQTNFGKSAASAGATASFPGSAVPEPAGGALLIIGALLVTAARARRPKPTPTRPAPCGASTSRESTSSC